MKKEKTMALPKLFVVGDSISVGYSPHLEKFTKGVFQFYGRKTGMEEALKDLDVPLGSNVGDSSMVLNYLKTMLTNSDWRPEILTLNCGLHDIKTVGGSIQIPIEDYRRNLRSILKLLADKDINVIWIRSTPVEDEQHNSGQKDFKRYSKDLDKYNAAADEIMNEAGIRMIDLYSFTRKLGKGKDIYRDHIHYHPEIESLQAAYIAGYLQAYYTQNTEA
jgi:hypothetical protein